MTKGRKNRALGEEDRALWREVKKTITPLSETRKFLELEFGAALGEPKKATKQTPASKNTQPVERPIKRKPAVFKPHGTVNGISNDGRHQHQGDGYRPLGIQAQPALDEQTWRRISKGKTAINRRVDLHGMTQVQAHGYLIRVLEEAYRLEERTVLVITGKGNGILQQAVPRWLQEPPMSLITSGCRHAHVSHGGEGALYVRIKRKRR